MKHIQLIELEFAKKKKRNKLGLSCAKLSAAELATNWLGASSQLAGS